MPSDARVFMGSDSTWQTDLASGRCSAEPWRDLLRFLFFDAVVLAERPCHPLCMPLTVYVLWCLSPPRQSTTNYCSTPPLSWFSFPFSPVCKSYNNIMLLTERETRINYNYNRVMINKFSIKTFQDLQKYIFYLNMLNNSPLVTLKKKKKFAHDATWN